MRQTYIRYIFLFVIFSSLLFWACAEKKAPQKEKPVKQNFWVSDTTSEIHGIDISHHQESIDWDSVKGAGVSFVFVKATEGIDYLDSMFVTNWKELEDENMIRGAYHFYISDDDPVEQAEWFVKSVGGFNNVLPPVVDVERAGHKHLTPEVYITNLMKCLAHVEKLTGKRPIIYSSPRFAAEYLINQNIGEYELWIAEYGVAQPVIPVPWQQPGWKFWQYTYQEVVPGIPKRVDKNIFADKYHKLLEMVN